MKILEIKGYNSLRALNGFHALMLGVKMLPTYMALSYEEFFHNVSLMPLEDQEKIIREAVSFVELSLEEVEAFLSFACDPNGIPYKKENLKNLNPKEILEIIVLICLEIAKMNVDLVTTKEKKN